MSQIRIKWVIYPKVYNEITLQLGNLDYLNIRQIIYCTKTSTLSLYKPLFLFLKKERKSKARNGILFW